MGWDIYFNIEEKRLTGWKYTAYDDPVFGRSRAVFNILMDNSKEYDSLTPGYNRSTTEDFPWSNGLPCFYIGFDELIILFPDIIIADRSFALEFIEFITKVIENTKARPQDLRFVYRMD